MRTEKPETKETKIQKDPKKICIEKKTKKHEN